MQYGLTKSTLDRAKLSSIPSGTETDYRFIWDVNYKLVCGKKLLIIVHADTRYAIICSDLKAGVWRDLKQFIHTMIETAMSREGFSSEEIARYFEMAGEEMITKTHGKKVIGPLNHVTEYLTYVDKLLVEGMYQTEISDTMNEMGTRTLATQPGVKYIWPKEFFVKRMKEMLRVE